VLTACGVEGCRLGRGHVYTHYHLPLSFHERAADPLPEELEVLRNAVFIIFSTTIEFIQYLCRIQYSMSYWFVLACRDFHGLLGRSSASYTF